MYLEVRIGAETLTPRKRVAATPYAFNAKYLDGTVASTNTSTIAYVPVSDASGNFNFNAVTSTGIYNSGLLNVVGNSSFGNITSGTWNGSVIAIARGGTGTTTAPTVGQLLIGNAAGNYDLVSTSSLGFLDTDTTTSPAGSTGEIQFNNSGVFGATSALYWDNSNYRLGIGTTTPQEKLDVVGKIAVNGVSLIYLPDQTNFSGTMYVGDGTGGANLAPAYVDPPGAWTYPKNDVYVGKRAGFATISGGGNTAVGSYTLTDNTTGALNTALGAFAMSSNTVGLINTAVGGSSLYGNTTGFGNTAVGVYAGADPFASMGLTDYLSVIDNDMVFLGALAGRSNAVPSTTMLTNGIAIGYGTKVSDSNTVVLGNDFIVTTLLKGNVGLGTAAPSYKLTVAGDVSVTGTLRVGNSADAGTAGYILSSNGSSLAPSWIATSTLGLSGSDIGGFTAGSVVFASTSGKLTQDNSNLFWDDANNRLGIGTTTPEFKLTLDNDGGIIARGTFGSGATLSTTGEGSRLIWYPRKAAFRAGYVEADEWDDANIGSYSVAMGIDTIANASGAVAIGDGSMAYGAQAVALGNGNIAGGVDSMALGGSNNVASGTASYALGSFMTVTGNYSFGVNVSTTAATLSQANTIALMGGNVGIGTTTPEFKLTLDNDGGILARGTLDSGAILTATGEGSRLIWYPRKAAFRAGWVEGGYGGTEWDDVNIGKYSVAMGGTPIASGESSLAMGGSNPIASGQESIAIGSGTRAYGELSMALGSENTASGTRSSAIGQYNTASGSYSFALGSWMNVNGNYSVGINASSTPATLNQANTIALMGGNVGVGTTSPRSKVDVDGTVTVLSSNNSGGAVITSTAVGNSPWNIAISGRYIFTSDDSSNLMSIMDVSNPAVPVRIATTSVNDSREVFISGHYAYLTSNNGPEFVVVDISNPAVPVQIASLDLPYSTYGVYVAGHYAYLTETNNKSMAIINVANPAAPVLTGRTVLSSGGTPNRLFVSGRYAYVLEDSSYVAIVDVASSSAPLQVATSTVGSTPRGIYVSGRYAYVTNYGSNSLSVVDISNPLAATQVATTGVGTGPYGVYVSGRYAYVANYSSDNISIVDISNPLAPASVATISTGASSGPVDIKVSGRYAYVANMGGNSVSVVDVGGVETGGLMAASAEFGNIQSRNDIFAGGNITARNSLFVGEGGVFSTGPLTVVGTSTISYFGGFMGVGTSTPPVAFTVQGNMIAYGAKGSNANDYVCIDTNGQISSKATACTGSSARRLKTDIKDVDIASNAILSLQPRIYTRLSNGLEEVGLIAEEVASSVPRMAAYDANGELYGVEYSQLPIYLLKVAKEQQIKLEELQGALNVRNESGGLTYVDGQDLNNQPLLNVKSIAGSNDGWAINEQGEFITRVDTSDGKKDMYAMRSPESEYIFSSSSQMINGEADIAFDIPTQEIIDPSVPIKVNITLTSGGAVGVYVKSKSEMGFVVKELNGGTSDATFDWMVIAKRRGASAITPAPTDDPSRPTSPDQDVGERRETSEPPVEEPAVTSTEPIVEPTTTPEMPVPTEASEPPVEEPAPTDPSRPTSPDQDVGERREASEPPVETPTTTP
ncbi:MAG: tail fiber domain-containing protein [Patescibacteria group bacterium]|nr:tail fiber domain-containing protein [Patescibacteria group bacterium]